MERHSLRNIEGNETTETKNIFHIPIIKEEIEIITEINENSNESLSSNDNDDSIPFCNILLSKFLDLTPENDLKPLKNELDARTASEQKNILDSYREIREIQENDLQDANEEVDIEDAIIKRKKRNERQRRYRERKKLENNELNLAKKRKSMAEASKRYRESQKMKKNELQDGKEEMDSEVEINKRKKNAERYKRYRQRQKIKKNNLQDANDIEADINERKKHAERQKRYTERKKLENNELYWANKRKRMAEAMKRYRLKKKKKNELLDANEQLDIEDAAVNKRKKTCKIDESCTF